MPKDKKKAGTGSKPRGNRRTPHSQPKKKGNSNQVKVSQSGPYWPRMGPISSVFMHRMVDFLFTASVPDVQAISGV
jgi:hypothetical protein